MAVGVTEPSKMKGLDLLYINKEWPGNTKPSAGKPMARLGVYINTKVPFRQCNRLLLKHLTI